MKRVIFSSIAVIFAFSLYACGGGGSSTSVSLTGSGNSLAQTMAAVPGN